MQAYTRARLVKRANQPEPRTEPDQIPDVIPDDRQLTRNAKELERKRTMDELEEAVVALEVDYNARIQGITALVEKLKLLN